MLSRRPVPPLDRFIAQVWTHQRASGLAHPREWGLPSGCPELVLPLDGRALRRFAALADGEGRGFVGGVLQGVADRPFLRDTSGPSLVVGAQFRPAGLVAWLSEPAHVFAGCQVAVADLWPGLADEVCMRLGADPAQVAAEARLTALEAALTARLRPTPQIDPFGDWAVGRIAGGASIGQVQRASGMAVATFIARYRVAVGLAPKRHADVLRLQGLLRAASRPDAASWVILALEAGFTDQAHLGRQFRDLTGMTPGRYRRDTTGWANHVAAPGARAQAQAGPGGRRIAPD